MNQSNTAQVPAAAGTVSRVARRVQLLCQLLFYSILVVYFVVGICMIGRSTAEVIGGLAIDTTGLLVLVVCVFAVMIIVGLWGVYVCTVTVCARIRSIHRTFL